MSESSTVVTAPEPELTLEQWAALPEDEPGELVDGRLEEEEVADIIHEAVVSWFIHVFRAWLTGRRAVVAGSEAKYAVRKRRGRKPDLTVYLPGSRRPPGRGLVRVPPDITVEVLSPTPRDERRDRIDKPDDYAAFGVRWYWLVDPQLRSLEILELGADGRYVRALGAGSERVEVVPGCEGLALDLPALWSEVEDLEREEPAAD